MIYRPGQLTDMEFPCEILRRLPGGSLAEVYLARLQNTRYLVVIKGVGGECSQELKSMIKREAEVLKQIRLATIPELYGYYEEAERRYFVMSYHCGKTLEDIILKQRYTEKQVKQLALSLCTTLGYLHKKGFVHGDLKPSNILLSEKNIVLLDYGAAVMLKNTGEKMYFQGTVGYAAPECFGDHKSAWSYQVDVFALGVTLYRMLEGADPKKHFGRFILTDVQKKNRWQPVLNKCCALKPEERYQSAAQVYNAIKEIKI